MALAVFATSNYLNLSSLNGFQELALPYSMVVLVGCVVYLVSCTALKHGELSEFRQLLTRRRT